jgi:hypothetical protein
MSEEEDARGHEEFREELGGITGPEVAGLLATIMRREYHQHTTSTNIKRVRRWKGDLMGIEVAVMEVSVGGGMRYDYHIENIEWEFKVRLEPRASSFSRGPTALTHLGRTQVALSYPWFEGDFDAYRHDMSMIRLMGLDNSDPEGIMAPKLEW